MCTKTNLILFVAMTLSIGSTVAMEKEPETSNDDYREQFFQRERTRSIYIERLSEKIDRLLEIYEQEELRNLITEINERTEACEIDDKDILPLLQKTCNRWESSTHEYDVSQLKSLIISTEHCDPSHCYFTIKKGVSHIILVPTPDKKLLIKSQLMYRILNETILATLGYNELNQKVLAQLPYDNFDKEKFAEIGRDVLKKKIFAQLGHNGSGQKVLGELQIIYPHKLMTIDNKFHYKVFLNAIEPSILTSTSPYAFVENNKTKKFLISDKEAAHQTITFPGASDTIKLPVDAQRTHFIIKQAPTSFDGAIIVNASSNEIIGRLTLLRDHQ